MRVKGGPRAQGARQAGKTSKAGKAAAAKFAGLLNNDPEDTEEKARQLRNRLLEEMQQLAQEVENGKSTKEEASRKFVGLVIRDRYGEQGKGAQNMEHSIADLVESDPNFVSRLHSQLKKIAKDK
jgi:cysteine sulfinate desulfinase/cysteine desulfurase-like protein